MLHRIIQEYLDARIGGEIVFNILGCLFPGDAQILAQPERADAIDDSKIDCLGIAPLLVGNLVKRNVEHLGRRNPVDVLLLLVGIDQMAVPGTMGQHAQLNLRIIRVYEDESVFRDEYLANQSSQFYTDRNILQVRLRTAQSSGCRDRLVELAVDPSVFLDIACKPVRIGGLQFCILPVLQDLCDDRVIRR